MFIKEFNETINGTGTPVRIRYGSHLYLGRIVYSGPHTETINGSEYMFYGSDICISGVYVKFNADDSLRNVKVDDRLIFKYVDDIDQSMLTVFNDDTLDVFNAEVDIILDGIANKVKIFR